MLSCWDDPSVAERFYDAFTLTFHDNYRGGFEPEGPRPVLSVEETPCRFDSENATC
jgi:hypothetical protein